MISFAQAKKTAQRYVQEMERESGIPLKLLEDRTIERIFGWAFFYDIARSLGPRGSDNTLAGNAPFIIDRRDGSLHDTGTAFPVEQYLQNYEQTGTPHPE